MGSLGIRPHRLAILEADTPQPNTKARYGGYGGVFTALLAAAAAPTPLSALLTVSSHDVVNDLSSYPPLESIDGILISGSRHSAFDDDEWIVKLVEYTRAALQSGRVRVVGVCFGHQIVGRALGMKVARSENGWEISVMDVGLTEKGKELFQMDRMRIHQMHRDAVDDFPPGSEALARTDLCPVQGMYVAGQYITIQGHPEFNEEIMTEILRVRHDMGVFSDDMFGEAMKRVSDEHDGVLIAKAFLRFLQGEMPRDP